MQRHLLNLSTGTIEVTDRVARTGWELQEKAEEGAYGSSTIELDDPNMDFAPEPIRSYLVIEDESEATDNVLYGGYTAEQAVGRLVGNGRRPLKRVWSITLNDRNSLWNRRTMVGTDCDREAEDDTARMQWLLGTSEASFIDDDASYVSTASPAAMDKVDYRGQYLNQIVDDCAQHTGKNWWLQLQESGAGRSNVAWYGKDSLSAYSSPLYLTNDRTAVSRLQLKDGTSLVWPISKDAELTYDPSRVYTGVYLRYGNGKAIYRRNPDVNDPDSPLYHVYRDFVADYPNVKTKPKAIARATRLLNDMAVQGQVITCDVELPKGKATMLRAGMRVPIKVSHWDPYTDWRWVRVLTCTVSPISAGQWYKLSLELAGPGTAASGPPAPPWTGTAFAALLRTTGDYGVGPYFEADGDTGIAGWYAEPTIGPLHLAESAAPFESIVADRAMEVRIEAAVSAAWVAAPGDTFRVDVVVNGVSVGHGIDGPTAGGYWSPSVHVDLSNISLAEGDVVGFTYTAAPGYPILNNGAVNATYLRVGRGTVAMNSGTVVWVGP